MKIEGMFFGLVFLTWSCTPCRVVELPMEKFDLAKLTQNKSDKLNEDFVAYDSPPTLIGGYASIKENIIPHYPDSARRHCVQATVYITAVVNEKGGIDTVIAHQDDHGWGFNDAAIIIIRETKFHPAKRQGVPVKVKITMPIIFRL
jgi:TonB family protein